MLTFTETFTIHHCSTCGVAYGLSNEFRTQRKSDRKMWYCPNGHTFWFPGETEAQRAQKLAGQLDLTETCLRAQREEAARLAKRLDYQERAVKAAATRASKLKLRAANGVCPCCNRTFKQLAAHMSSQHPKYTHQDT